MFSKCKKDDIVDIIFPATSCSKNEIEDIKNYVKNNLGLRPRIPLEDSIKYNSSNHRNEFPVNSASYRFDQLKSALLKEDSKIIWCARGGYGSGDLLPFLEKIHKIEQRKLFIGFSDITSISEFLQQSWGWNIIYGPVLLQLSRNEIVSEAILELENIIFQKQQKYYYNLDRLDNLNTLININAEVSGGCLSVLSGHFGGKYQAYFHNKILFLEDEGEDGERLDRYFRQIIENINNTKQVPKAILLGNFLQKNNHGSPKPENITIAINKFIQNLKNLDLEIPIFRSARNEIGHGHKMRPLILGYNANISKINQHYKLNYQL